MQAEERRNETPDPDTEAARRKLEAAQSHLANEQHTQATLTQDPRWFRWTPDQQMNVRGQMSERVRQAKDAVSTAEKALWTAEGAATRKRYLARLEAEKQAKRDEHERIVAEQAAQVEAEAKKQFRAAWPGLDADFEQAWPGMWTAEKKRRTREHVAERERAMRARYANYL
jgi:hypothetical protein